MPYRKTTFINNGIYHVLNRGIERGLIFKTINDKQRFLEAVEFYKHNPSLKFSYYRRLLSKEKGKILIDIKKTFKPLVDILAFSLMPNHFHFLLRQLQNKGTQLFMGNFQNSYVKYFNTKYRRKGPLFQSAFKSVPVKTDEQLIHVSRYIHLNPVSSNIIQIRDLKSYPWTSFHYYFYPTKKSFITSNVIMGYFKTKREHQKFVFDQVDYQRELQVIKNLALK